ncbi:MAG: hypothetical protein SPL08_05030 [Pseudomonadota bacterium]|nr:hypothetical protein [Pseudomonadota bacterium]
MKDKQYHEACDFMPKTRLGERIKHNFSWNERKHLHHRQIIDAGGFVFDLDKNGGIVRMTDEKGNTFNTKEVKKLFL